MNSYQLIPRLRKVRDDTYLTTAAQALYYELVAICNEIKWKDVFFVRSNILCGNLDMSDNTLRKSRECLSNAGLIHFRSCKDRRIGCYYSFIHTISDELISSSISSAKFAGENADDIEDGFEDDKKKGVVSTSVESSAIPSAESSAKIEDEKKTSSSISSAKNEDDTQITPYKGIINYKQGESHTHTRETPPPKKAKSSRKKEGDDKSLEYPFTSIRFMSTWEALRQTPKWKNKLNYALQLSLNKLGKFEEDFAVEQMERAIESNWTGVVFSETESKYQEWLNRKYGKPNNPAPAANKSTAERKESVDKLTDLAGNVLRAIAAEKLK